MARLTVHYEAAFEDYLQTLGWPYVPTDEHRRSNLAGVRVKSFDFLVYPPGGSTWMVDVKGRKFPYDLQHGRRFWENWVTRDDLEGLRQWQGAFGAGFEPMFVFAYWILDGSRAIAGCRTHDFRERRYAFLVVSAKDYGEQANRRSSRWNTVTVPHGRFRKVALPVDQVGTAAANETTADFTQMVASL